MLGGKLNFNPMRPDESTSIVKDENPRASDTKDTDEEKTYESIVNEKTSIINKKKPKMRLFNSNLNEQSRTTLSPFDDAIQSREQTMERIKEIVPISIEPEITSIKIEKKIIFDLIENEPMPTMSIPFKPKNSLFDFEDTDSTEVGTKSDLKQSTLIKKNTPANANKKISFLFDEE